MAAKRDEHHDDKGHPPVPTHSSDGPPAPRHTPPQQPVAGQSQKSQISQYFKSQGRQPDDVVWSIGGLNLRLSDLD